jgi:GTPase SAR1 family protein
MRDPNYLKPKHILLVGPSNLGKTNFLRELLKKHLDSGEAIKFYNEAEGKSNHTYNNYIDFFHTHVYDYEWDWGKFNIDTLKVIFFF